MNLIEIEQFSNQQRKDLDIPDQVQAHGPWSVWECEPSQFDWQYSQIEKAFIYEGKVTVKTEDQEVEIKTGDFVTFPQGLACRWTVHETIRKVYKFE